MTSTDALTAHINHCLDTHRDVPVGKGYNWDQGDVITRVGHIESGWYIIASWRVMNSEDRDDESRSCHCKLQGKPHAGIHRLAPTLDGLLTTPTQTGCY